MRLPPLRDMTVPFSWRPNEGDSEADFLGNGLREWIGGTLEVKAGERTRKEVYVLANDGPDLFVHRVPEGVLEGNVQGTQETSLCLEGNAGRFQCGSVNERDRGLQEAPSDAPAVYGADPIPLMERTPQQYIDGIGDCVGSDVGAASSLFDREIQAWDDGAAMCSITKRDYIRPGALGAEVHGVTLGRHSPLSSSETAVSTTYVHTNTTTMARPREAAHGVDKASSTSSIQARLRSSGTFAYLDNIPQRISIRPGIWDGANAALDSKVGGNLFIEFLHVDTGKNHIVLRVPLAGPDGLNSVLCSCSTAPSRQQRHHRSSDRIAFVYIEGEDTRAEPVDGSDFVRFNHDKTEAHVKAVYETAAG
ncbi:hypothetical protein EDD17DRAFT_1507424 [Pisolithus thermaeus]|nr:hypothetical protein EDD17DRAFT_1507424 [Pisolithus thermaeus]